jgi:hypothetical protein
MSGLTQELYQFMLHGWYVEQLPTGFRWRSPYGGSLTAMRNEQEFLTEYWVGHGI